MRTNVPRTLVPAAILLFALGACDREAPPPPPALDAETTRRLFEHMEELVAAIRARPSPAQQGLAATSAPTVATMERTAADASLAALRERVESLEREVAQLRASTPEHGVGPRLAARPQPKVIGLVNQTAAQLADETTRAEARRSLFMLDMAQVVERLGAPDASGIAKDGIVWWSYQAEQKNLLLRFHNGFVMTIEQ